MIARSGPVSLTALGSTCLQKYTWKLAMSSSTSASNPGEPTGSDAVTLIMEPNNTRLRLVAQGDVPYLVELEALLFPDTCWNERTLSDTLEDGFGWLTENDQEVTGYAIVKQAGPLLDLLRLGVRPTYQRMGLGTKLIERALGRKAAILTVLSGNPAIHLYRAQGFKAVGMLDGAWVMRR
jgi:ribosomal protein S18 acetylase RimI-like enzyme